MVSYVKRKDLDTNKYNYCIENSRQSRIYAFSWYLDIIADNWDVLVFDNYKAVMPIPWKRKYGLKYVVHPFWCIELGIFSILELDISIFLKEFTKLFFLGNLRLNTSNRLYEKVIFLKNRELQQISLFEEEEKILQQYRKDRKKDLRKATNANLKACKGSSEELITLFKNNIGKRTNYIKDKDYNNLSILIKECSNRGVADLLSVKNINNELVGAAFFLKHKNVVTILVSATDLKNRNNGVNTFLIHNAILEYKKDFDFLNFGGSSIKSIAKYFLSFGAETKLYQQINYNKFIRFKRF